MGVGEAIEPRGTTIDTDAAFVATILDGAANIAPAREAAHVVALTEASFRSIAEGRIVEIEGPA